LPQNSHVGLRWTFGLIRRWHDDVGVVAEDTFEQFAGIGLPGNDGRLLRFAAGQCCVAGIQAETALPLSLVDAVAVPAVFGE
jgi:hypothetical protein